MLARFVKVECSVQSMTSLAGPWLSIFGSLVCQLDVVA